uniref:Uncharacterized protein n=1 Tax=Pseudobryopsis hainanensis TaxID=2320808 RepID=A0A3S5X157_9CHLO|nr:hypothetical protein [Pseudobryopsis hainanensis]
MTLDFYSLDVNFSGVAQSAGSLTKHVTHNFATDIRSGDASLKSFYIAYPDDRREVRFVGAQVQNVQYSGTLIECDVVLSLEDGGTIDSGGEASPDKSKATVLFVVDRE